MNHHATLRAGESGAEALIQTILTKQIVIDTVEDESIVKNTFHFSGTSDDEEDDNAVEEEEEEEEDDNASKKIDFSKSIKFESKIIESLRRYAAAAPAAAPSSEICVLLESQKKKIANKTKVFVLYFVFQIVICYQGLVWSDADTQSFSLAISVELVSIDFLPWTIEQPMNKIFKNRPQDFR
jgi:hypothetical protein